MKIKNNQFDLLDDEGILNKISYKNGPNMFSMSSGGSRKIKDRSKSPNNTKNSRWNIEQTRIQN